MELSEILAGLFAVVGGIVSLAVFARAGRRTAAFMRAKPVKISAFSDYILLAFLVVATAFVALSISRLFYDWLGAENALATFVPTFAMQLLAISAVWLFCRFSEARAELGFAGSREFFKGAVKEGGRYFLYAIAVVFSANFAVSMAVYSLTGEFPPKQEAVELFGSLENPWEVSLSAVSIAVFAPVAEELVFRGLLYGILKGLWANFRFGAVAAAALSGVLFALIHNDAYVFLPLALMGMCLCFAYERSGSIVSPIIVHSLFNSLNLIFILFLPR